MTVSTYEHIALQWQPDSKDNKRFHIITAIVIVIALVIGIGVRYIDVPEDDRRVKPTVPDRIAQFIKKQPKPKVVPPKPKPKPKPIPKPKPKVEREKEEKKPLTKEEKKARAKAEKSGILALVEEFADLIDSSAVDAAVSAKVVSADGAKTAKVGHNTDVLTAGTSKGSGGVDASQYATTVGTSALSQRELALVQQSLFKEDVVINETKEGKKGERGDNVRSEEEVTIVFDQNKGRLQSIYNRERRKTPGLQGKIVFEITVLPEGIVTNVKILKSELDHPALERRLIARIKMFKFGAKDVEPVTVTFPIEFLPS